MTKPGSKVRFRISHDTPGCHVDAGFEAEVVDGSGIVDPRKGVVVRIPAKFDPSALIMQLVPLSLVEPI